MKSFFQKRKSAEESQEKKQKDAEQKIIGDEIFEILKEASGKNTVYNIFQYGEKCEQIEPIVVARIPNNGNNYMIGVGIPKPTMMSSNFVGIRGYSILHVSVDLSRIGNELVYLCGDYSPERQFSINDIEGFKKRITDYVSSFRLFN
jgi:hypothetical protein